MKKQKIALYLVAFVCFAICFIVLNRKYDRFYRINGIDNENRQLIINYLDPKEQNYLVENSFPMERFARFLKVPDFDLFDLEYYEKMESVQITHPEAVVNKTNQLLEKLRSEDGVHVESAFNQLMDSGLADAYLQTPAFLLEYLELYDTYHTITHGIDAKTIEQLNELSIVMKSNQLSMNEQKNFLKQWLSQYSLKDLMNYWQLKHENKNLTLMNYPDSLTTVISDGMTISSYEPEPLTIPYNVARVRFACYLRQDATVALEELANKAKNTVNNETLLLVEAYHSYDDLLENEKQEAGQSEYQLGLSVDFMSMGIDYNDFSNTNMSAFLKEHSWEYGFILRYPDSENANTYRFVGKDAARVMHEKGLSLEAYEGIANE